MLALWFSARKPRATVRTNRARKPRECVETHFLRRMRKENWEMRLRVCARKRFVCVYARNDAPLLKYTNSNGRPLARNEWYGVFVLSLSLFFLIIAPLLRDERFFVQTRVPRLSLGFGFGCVRAFMCIYARPACTIYTDFSFL